MKRIVLVVALFLAFAGVATGSSLNGDYKGNPIVIIKSSGVPLQSDEVPAMVIDGHTMVPISLLRQIGVTVNWDANTYSVDVKLPQQQNTTINTTNSNTTFPSFTPNYNSLPQQPTYNVPSYKFETPSSSNKPTDSDRQKAYEDSVKKVQQQCLSNLQKIWPNGVPSYITACNMYKDSNGTYYFSGDSYNGSSNYTGQNTEWNLVNGYFRSDGTYVEPYMRRTK